MRFTMAFSVSERLNDLRAHAGEARSTSGVRVACVMRIAVTLGTLRIPPTYFAVQHTGLLADRHELKTFALVADVADEALLSSSKVDIVDFVPFRRLAFRQRELAMPASMLAMSRAVAKFRPDVIHQHFATWSMPAVRASAAAHAPLILTMHGADVFAALRRYRAVTWTGRPMLAWHHRNVAHALASATRILTVSEFLANSAFEAGAPVGRVEVHYQGIDTEYFQPIERANGDGPIVLFVGALNEAKGVPDLIDASLSIMAKHPHELRLVGDGPLREWLNGVATAHPHVRVLGRVDREGVRTQMQRADVMVLPTQRHNGWQEAAGLVLLEAQACGTPVVAYASGGTPEMLRHEETGVLVTEYDRVALAGAIAEVISAGRAEARAMSKDARDFVVGQRSLVESVRQLDSHYTEVASGAE